MPTPQPGIFGLGTRQHYHLQFEGRGDPNSLINAVRQLREMTGTVLGVNVVVGLGPDLLAALSSGDAPEGFAGFTAIEGPDGFTIPVAQHDLWIWIHGAGQDAVLDVARSAVSELDDVASLASEQQSFAYGSSRDLTGFEDGTENPTIDDAQAVATLPHSQSGGGGSIVLLQRWVHDLEAFDVLDIPARERVIGRTMAESIELDDSVQPPTSHVSRVVVEDDIGEELEVFRRSTAFGGVREHGLMFLAFSADQARLQHMLERMAGTEDGVRDKLTEYSTPSASAWYFAPPVEVFRSA